MSQHNGENFVTTATLFNEPLFSDFTIIVGDRTFSTHKAVLCGRSKWFRHLICGKFKEAQTRIVTLQEDDPAAVESMLRWLYGLPWITDSNKSIYETWIVADKYLIDELKNQLFRGFQKALIRIEKDLHSRRRANLAAAKLEYNLKTWYAETATDSHRFRGALEDFCAENHHIINKTQYFRELFPDLRELVLKAFARKTIGSTKPLARKTRGSIKPTPYSFWSRP